MAILLALAISTLVSMASCEPPIQPYNYHAHRPSNQYLPPESRDNQGYNPTSYNPTSYNPTSYNPTSYNSEGYDSASSYNPSGYADQGSKHHGHDNEVPKAYNFGYTVRDARSGNDYSRHESSDGDVTRGEYRVLLPDGRTQIVTYHADWRTGYHADVRYEGEARYPEPQTRPHTGSSGYNYQAPGFSGSLTGFHGNQQNYQTDNSGYP